MKKRHTQNKAQKKHRHNKDEYCKRQTLTLSYFIFRKMMICLNNGSFFFDFGFVSRIKDHSFVFWHRIWFLNNKQEIVISLNN